MTLQASFASLAVVAVLLRALFIAAETALIGVSPERAEELHAAHPSIATRALRALKLDVEGSFASTRVGSILALAIGAASAGAAALRAMRWSGDDPLGLVVAACFGGLISAAACFFVDTIPRSLAIADPERWALRVALPLRLVAGIVAPPARAIRASLDWLLSPLGVRATFRAADPALEDIERILLEESREDRDAPAAELVHSLFEFPNRIAREVMVPRTEVAALPLRIEPAVLVRLVAEEGHSRFPVFDLEIDRIVGVLHTRDIVPLLAHPELIKVPDLIRPAVFVPWAMKIGRLLEQMQRDRIHMAMVTDEHGGFMGIVTLEDILEELVGEIHDEKDDAEGQAIELDADGARTVKAAISVEAFNELFDAALPEDHDFGTLAGFLNHLAGEIPDVGATLLSHGLSFTVKERGPTRVLRVRVVPQPTSERSSA